MKQTLEHRFHSKIRKTPTCWVWVGSLNRLGYGNLWDGQSAAKAHRVSYRLHKGDIPQGMCVLHRCDNRCCVNPDHLFLGTQQDNMRDRNNKGRQARNVGVSHGRSKLTEDQVLVVRGCPDLYGASAKLARHFGVTPTAVCSIRKGHNWTHLGEPTQAHRDEALRILLT